MAKLEEQTREGLARHLCEYRGSKWETAGRTAREDYLVEADAILAIAAIQEGQELREKAESGKLVELDEDQQLQPVDIGPDEPRYIEFRDALEKQRLRVAYDAGYHHGREDLVCDTKHGLGRKRVNPLASGESR